MGLERSDSSPLTLCSPSGSPLRHHRRMFCMESPKRVEEFLSRSYVQSGAHGLPKGSDTESHSRIQLLLVSRGKFPSITAHGRFLLSFRARRFVPQKQSHHGKGTAERNPNQSHFMIFLSNDISYKRRFFLSQGRPPLGHLP